MKPVRHRPALLIACVVLSVLSLPLISASAHHATAAEYDISKTVVLKGTILAVDWANPHIHVVMRVKAERGPEQDWEVEFPAPGAATVAGLSKQVLAPGAVLTFKGYPSKPDFHPDPRSKSSAQWFACAIRVTLSDGSQVTFVVGI